MLLNVAISTQPLYIQRLSVVVVVPVNPARLAALFTLFWFVNFSISNGISQNNMRGAFFWRRF
jgi:hypothetical protein